MNWFYFNLESPKDYWTDMEATLLGSISCWHRNKS